MSELCRRICSRRGQRHQAAGNAALLLQALAAAAAVGGSAILAVAEACAQAPVATSRYSSAGAINLGGRGWAGSESRQAVPESAKSQLEFEVRGGLATDYVYRGVTLSDRKPAVGAAIEATYNLFYAGVTVASVRLPTQPAAEISLSGGIRPTFGPVEFDLGVTYFSYPGEAPAVGSNGINYWEAALRAGTTLGEAVRIAGGFAYSPNVSNTGAWSGYAAGGLGYDVPGRFLPKDVGVSLTAAAGYSWFGHQYADLGGFPLPAYLNWQAGVTITRKMLNLDLRYHDTNLTKENCFVFTGDPNAQAGGHPDPITNPDGLTSRWCGAAFVAKLWFAFN